MTKTKQAIQEILATIPTATFTNEHGEKFIIKSNGVTVMMGGSEVDAMVDPKNHVAPGMINLFNPVFSIWSREELYLLGKALVELHAPTE